MKNLYIESFGTVTTLGEKGYGIVDDDYFVICKGTPGVPSSVRVGRFVRYSNTWHDRYGPGTMSVSSSDVILAALIDRDYGNDMNQIRQYQVESFMRPFFTPGVTTAHLAILLYTALAIHLPNDDLIGVAPVFFSAGARYSADVYFMSTDLPAWTKYYATFGLE